MLNLYMHANNLYSIKSFYPVFIWKYQILDLNCLMVDCILHLKTRLN